MEVVVPSLNTLDGKHVYVYNIYYAETTLLASPPLLSFGSSQLNKALKHSGVLDDSSNVRLEGLGMGVELTTPPSCPTAGHLSVKQKHC